MDYEYDNKIKNIKEICKKYRKVIKNNIINKSDIDDVETIILEELYTNEKWKNKIEDYHKYHLHFIKLFKHRTFDYNKRQDNVEFRLLLTEEGYIKEYKQPEQQKRLTGILELDINHRHYLNSLFAEEVKKRLEATSKIDFDAERAYIVYFLNVIVGYKLGYISEFLGIHRNSARSYKNKIEKVIKDIIAEQFGDDYIKNIKEKLKAGESCRIEISVLADFIRGFGEDA